MLATAVISYWGFPQWLSPLQSYHTLHTKLMFPSQLSQITLIKVKIWPSASLSLGNHTQYYASLRNISNQFIHKKLRMPYFLQECRAVGKCSSPSMNHRWIYDKHMKHGLWNDRPTVTFKLALGCYSFPIPPSSLEWPVTHQDSKQSPISVLTELDIQ